MKIKKLLALALTVAMVLSMLVMPAAAAGLTDVPGHWAENSIQRWVDSSILNGYEDGTFKPDGYITRAEFATILAKTLGLTEKGNVSFSDVEEENHWAKDYIYACAAVGIVTGYTDGTFAPDNFITRQEAMAMFVRALQLSAYVAEESYLPLLMDWFVDGDQVGSWAYEYAVAMVVNNAMQGSATADGKGLELRPLANISRAEVAIILDRLIAGYVGADGKLSTTTQDQIDLGLMGDRFVVHADADVSIMGKGEGVYEISTETDSVQIDMEYSSVCVLYNGFSDYIYNDGYEISGGEMIYYYKHSLPSERISTNIYYDEDGTERKYVYKTEFVYDEENWNLEQVLSYEDGELISDLFCEFDENNRPAKIYRDGILTRSYEYNDNGDVVVEISYNWEGQIRYKYEWVYDDQGRPVEAYDTYYDYWYDYQYDDNGDLVVDDEGNPVEVWFTDEETYKTIYTYDEFGNQVMYQSFYDDGELSTEYVMTYDENGEELLEEHYKSYDWYYVDGEKVYYLGYEYVDSYENGYRTAYESISHTYEGEIRSHEKELYVYDEIGRQVKIEEYSLIEGSVGLSGTRVTEYEGDSWDRTAQYYVTADGDELWRHTYEYTETEEGSIYKEFYYEDGELVYYSEEEYKYETGEDWFTEYDSEGNVNYESYSYNESDDDTRHYHSESKYGENSVDIYDYYYFYVALPDNYTGSDWDDYYYY